MSTFLITSDWHIRNTTPKARLDNYQAALWNKVEQIMALAKEHDAHILFGGDLFDVPKSAIESTVKLVSTLGNQFLCGIPGQHDLPNHLIKNIDKCSFGLMLECGYVRGLEGSVEFEDTSVHFFPWGSSLGPRKEPGLAYNIAVCHTLTYKGKSDIGGIKAKTLLRKMKGFDLIVVGDNHKTFVVEHEGRYLVSPGSLMRQDADQFDHEPSVFLWKAGPNSVPERIRLKVTASTRVLTREHLDRQKERESRLDAFIETVNTKYDVDINFMDNLKKFMNKNQTNARVQELVWEATNADE